MNRIRSSGWLPTVKTVDPDRVDEEPTPEADDTDSWWGSIAVEALIHEETLPDAGDDFFWSQPEPDEYERAWDRIAGWREDLDDEPVWVLLGQDPCRRCNEYDFVDPQGTCAQCRGADNRCRWCNLDQAEYRRLRACRTCYRRLRRSTVTDPDERAESMLKAAFLRYDLRKRRGHGRPST